MISIGLICLAFTPFFFHNCCENVELNWEDELDQLRASVDYLVELCETVSLVSVCLHMICC